MSVKLPDDVAKKLIPGEQYKNARPVTDHEAWNNTSKDLAGMWQEKVLVNLN